MQIMLMVSLLNNNFKIWIKVMKKILMQFPSMILNKKIIIIGLLIHHKFQVGNTPPGVPGTKAA